MAALRIFIVHGHDTIALDELRGWFSTNGASIEVMTLANLGLPGETIPAELERIANLGDAAVILATPDDIGGGVAAASTRPRARQNVWLELGWFWARLGRRRSLLLIKGSLERPSDTDGVLYVPFQNSISEIDWHLARFLDRIKTSAGDDVTEVLTTDIDIARRTHDYQLTVDAAEREVIITGTGMANIRHDLPRILGQIMSKKPALKITFITLDASYLRSLNNVNNTIYRRSLIGDIDTFDATLSDCVKQFPQSKNRLTLMKYAGLVTFVATVGDPGDLGSLMTVETILPAGSFNELARPRLHLRRRVHDGIYDRYHGAIKAQQNQSRVVQL